MRFVTAIQTDNREQKREMTEKNRYQLQTIEKDVICFYHTESTIRSQGGIVPYHRHDAYEIYLFLEGNIDFYLEKDCYRLKRGDMVVVAPTQLHRVVCLDEGAYKRYGVNVKQFLLDRLSSASTSEPSSANISYSRNHKRI